MTVCPGRIRRGILFRLLLCGFSVPAAFSLLSAEGSALPRTASETATDRPPENRQVSPAREASSYPDRRSGDDAYRAEDYAVAASFYRKYREEAKKGNDREALRDAFEREIDALIRSGLAGQAEETLGTYERSFAGINSLSVSLWRANICLLQKRIPEAESLLTRILPLLPKNDPRRMQATASLAFACELRKDYSKAAEHYAELAGMDGDSSLVRQSAEREILMRIAAGDADTAFEKLRSMPLANRNRRDLKALKHLSFYLRLKKDGPEKVADLWRELAADPPEKKEMFFHIALTLIASEFQKAKDIRHAIEAYRAAYDCAPSPAEEHDTLSRMAEMLEQAGDKEAAASLALSQYELFQGAAAAPGVKLRTAELLAHAGKNDSALAIYRSIFENGNLNETDRESAFRTAFQTFLDGKSFDSAEKLIDLFYRQFPDPAEYLLHKAAVRMSAGAKKEAADLFRQAGDLSSVHRRSAYARAIRAYSELRLFDPVIELCGVILKSDPKDPVIFYRADAFDNLNKIDPACADYRVCAELPDDVLSRPLKAQAVYRIAHLLTGSGRIREAIPYFQTVSRKYGDTAFGPPSGCRLVSAYTILGEDMNAEKETWLLADRYPDSEYTFSAFLRLAAYYSSNGDTARAQAALESAVSQTKYPAIRARALYEKALLAYRNGEYDAAEKLIRALETEFPADSDLSSVLYLRGDVCKQQGRFEEAIRAYEEAAKRRPGSMLELAALGEAGDCCFATAARKDQPEWYLRALEYYRKVAEGSSSVREYQAMAGFKSARCLQLLGKPEEAGLEYRKLIYLIPAGEASAKPAETFWIVKGAEALAAMAAEDPSGSRLEDAAAALNWLEQAGVLTRSNVQKRILAIRRKKYRPIIQEIHNR